MNRKMWFLRIPVFVHFDGLPFMSWAVWPMFIWIGGGTPILYIYSLRHFLTTKGALIDGDGYPPKNPQNGSKKVSKNMEI